MKLQTSAFLVRSLRQESRLISHHVIRAALTGLVLYLLLTQILTFALRAAAGNTFASTVMTCCYWFVTLMGGIYFSTAIVEEKEAQTLPLLRMTGASAFSILLGKSLPRLTSVGLLILVITPFLMLAVTLGGVVARGVLTSILGILAYAVLICQIGLFASVVSNDAQRAFSKTLLIWGFLEFLPFWTWLALTWVMRLAEFNSVQAATQYLTDQVGNGGAQSGSWTTCSLAWLSVELSGLTGHAESVVLWKNLPLYLATFSGEPIWRTQMTAHLILAACFFCASLVLFHRFTGRVIAEDHSPEETGRIRRSPRRPWQNALAWKAWQHTAGGWLWFYVLFAGAPLLVAGLAAIMAYNLDDPQKWVTIGYALLWSGLGILAVNSAVLFGRLFNAELRDDTLAVVFMLPRSTVSIVRRSVVGLVPSLLSSASCFVCGVCLLASLSGPDKLDTTYFMRQPWTYAVIVWSVVTIMLGLVLSVRIRYGGMLLAFVVMWMIIPLTIASCLNVVFMGVGGSGVRIFFEVILPVMVIATATLAGVILHFVIINSLVRAAEAT